MISDRLNEERKRRGLTNQQLAELSGVPLSTITRVLNGETKDPTITTLNAITAALGITLDDIFHEVSNNEHGADLVSRQMFNVMLSEKNAQIARLQNEKKVLFIILMCCFVLVFAFTLVDAINGRVGWIRYGEWSKGFISGLKQALFAR